MANRYAGLDPTWAHLPTPAPAHAAAASHYCASPAWLRAPGAAFENEALTSALRASMAPAHAAAAASSLSSPATPSSSTSSASELLSSGGGGGHDAPAPASTRPGGGGLPARASAQGLAGPKGGRVAKRRPRPSRRAQTTYITAAPADFRRMVQEITGLPVPGPSSSSACSFPAAASGSAPTSWTPAPACVLPTLDTSAFLLDRAAPATAPALKPEDRSGTGGGGYAPSAAADGGAVAAAGDEDPSVLLELEAMVRGPAGACGFPTLDLESWGII
ncbi:hypothetical protein BS78_03G120400 [Paspalum vaginatum]|nr:hypothetical protein BS78_03G120400 [Paspalum vaginatum]